MASLNEWMEKAKYIKRTGTPGNYKYEYADKKGPKKTATAQAPTGKVTAEQAQKMVLAAREAAADEAKKVTLPDDKAKAKKLLDGLPDGTVIDTTSDDGYGDTSMAKVKGQWITLSEETATSIFEDDPGDAEAKHSFNSDEMSLLVSEGWKDGSIWLPKKTGGAGHESWDGKPLKPGMKAKFAGYDVEIVKLKPPQGDDPYPRVEYRQKNGITDSAYAYEINQPRGVYGPPTEKAKKSMVTNLEDWMQKSEATPDTLSKAAYGTMSKAYVDDWAMQFSGTGMHVEALQCLKDLMSCRKERDKFNAAGKSWREEEEMTGSARKSYREKRMKEREKLNERDDKVHARMSALEERLLDQRIKDAKNRDGMYKSEVSPEKARKILHDGEVHGKPLTEQQRKYFGAIGGHLPAPGEKAKKSMEGHEALNDFLEKAATPVGGTTPGGYKKIAEGKYVKEGAKKEGSAAPGKPEKHDVEAVRELALYAENNGDLYRQRIEPIHKNLMRKIAAGKYDHEKAKKLWQYAAADAAQRYTKEFGGSGPHGSHGSFSPADRRALAAKMADDFKDAADDGEYDHLIPKKYQKKEKTEKSLRDFVNEDWMEKAWEASMETIEEYLEKAALNTPSASKEMPSHEQRMGGPKSQKQGASQDGGSLEGTGKTSGSSDSAAGPGQDASGQISGTSTKKDKLSDDDAVDEGQMKPHKKPLEQSVKKSLFPADQRDSVARERAAAVSQLHKSDDVYIGPNAHPFSSYSVHSSGDDDAAELVKSESFYHGNSPQVAPNRAIIDSGVLCKSVNANGCDAVYSAALTACPGCGAGTVGHRHVPGGPVVGSEIQILEKSEGPGSLLRRPPQEPDVKIGE